jgi:hypothetical protein
MTNAERLPREYLAAYSRVMAALQLIEAKIHDLPAPDSDGLNWANFGDMARIAEQLEEIAKP